MDPSVVEPIEDLADSPVILKDGASIDEKSDTYSDD